jgi:CHAT domain-containing protein
MVLVCVLPGSGAQDEPVSASAMHQAKLQERDRLGVQARSLRAGGKLAEAAAAVEKMVAIEREVLGKMHGQVADSLAWLAEIHEEREDFAAARKARKEVLRIRAEVDGLGHWRVTDARLALAHVDILAGLSAGQRRQLQRAAQLNDEMIGLARGGKIAEALSVAHQTLELYRHVLGEKHPTSAAVLHNLAALHYLRQDYARSQTLFREALEIRKQVLGEGHPDYLATLNGLAAVAEAWAEQQEQREDFAAARKLRHEVLQLKAQRHGAGHWQTTDARLALANVRRLAVLTADERQRLTETAALHEQATVLHEQGKDGEAVSLAVKTEAICKELLGTEHPYYHASLNNLALLYKSMGDHARAEPLYRRVLELRKQVLGENHPHYALSLNNLAALHRAMGEYPRAEEGYRQALRLRKLLLGEMDPLYAQSLSNLAALYRETGDYARAEPLFRQAREVYLRTLGEQHPEYATCLNNLALLYDERGDYAHAEEFYRHVLKIQQQTLGEQHPSHAATVVNLAALSWAQGQPDRAEPLLQRAAQTWRDNLDLAAAGQSERQQLAMTGQLRGVLDAYLSLAPRARQSGAAVYRQVLAWKGSVLLRQRWLRQRRHPDLARGLAELDQLTGRLANLVFATPSPPQQEARRQLIRQLTEQKDRLEAELARQSTSFRAEKAARRLSPTELQEALPPEAVLLDFLEYTRWSPPQQAGGKWSKQRCLAAFVVRRDRPIEQLDLGPVEPIARAVEAWRQNLRGNDAGKENGPGAALRRLVWDPFARHVRDARIILLSPDGTLTRFPFAALPGKEPGCYLVEERALAVVAVPQLLPELLARPQQAVEPSLCLVGAVRFDADPGAAEAGATKRSAPRNGLPQWGPLAGTLREIRAVKEAFQRSYKSARVTELREGDPTEKAVRRQASRHRFLHLATHGFFAPPPLRSALAAASRGDHPAAADLFSRQDVAGFHPGLLSGLVLAGANRPVNPEEDDGILTALEVAELDLSGVELATLSACETGLGEAAGGEGLLGLQRAFQVAGARSVVAGLWKVPDRATQVLMARFYDNLWQKNMGKIEALREAQRWMLREASKSPEMLRGLTRGLDFAEDQRPQPDRPLAPFFWAAFILSGDWRDRPER